MITKNNLSLYHLGEQHQNLLSKLYDYETGEINKEVEAQISALLPTINEKCIAVAKWIKKIEHDRNEIQIIKEEISKREEAYNKEVKKRQEYLKNEMEKNGITKISCPYFTLQIKKNPYSTDIISEFDIPAEFMKIKEPVMPTPKPDKEAIKKHVLETGEQVSGAHVSQKTCLVISVDQI